MAICQHLLIVSIVITVVHSIVLDSIALDPIDDALKSINIYYQRLGPDNERIEQPIDDVTHLDSSNGLVFTCHGWFSNRSSKFIYPITKAYVNQNITNVFAMEWGSVSMKNYVTAKEAVPEVSKLFAIKIDNFLDKLKIPYSKVHFIGHSLGAHVVGCTSRRLKQIVDRITGLDPALPLYYLNTTESLQPFDGSFVVVIHTGSPFCGDNKPRGTVDFYPNCGMAPQPGCPKILGDSFSYTLMFGCDHKRAVDYYEESIYFPRNFPAKPCSSARIAQQVPGKCFLDEIEENVDGLLLLGEVSDEDVSNTTVFMGDFVPRDASGSYCLRTNPQPPYGQGSVAE